MSIVFGNNEGGSLGKLSLKESFAKSSIISNNREARGYMRCLTEDNYASIKNGIALSEDKIFLSRNNSYDFNTIKNSATQGAGWGALISQLAVTLGEVYKQQVFIGNKDKNGNLITLDRMIPTVQQSSYSYFPVFYYQQEADTGRINYDMLFEGINQNGGQTRQTATQLGNAVTDYKDIPIYMYSNTVSYNELQMQTMKKFIPDAWNKALEGFLKNYTITERLRNLVGNTNLGIKGLLNCDAIIDEDETGANAVELGLTVPLRELLKDQTTNWDTLNNIVNGLRKLKNGKVKGYDVAEMQNAKFIVPVEDYQYLQDVKAFKYIGNERAAQWLMLIENMGIEVLPCDVASSGDAEYNKTGKNIYQLYDASPDVIKRVDIQDLSLYGGLHTANGVDFNGVFTSQFVLPFVINKNKIIRFKISDV
jgi:hypothetical protein